MTRDPGLPRQNPTSSYWQHVPHPLANTQSGTLRKTADIAVIGSGITGASVAKTLLENNPSSKIIVFEARSLCSGATGRNGGQLATNAGEIYAKYKAHFGSEMAGRIAAFSFKTCDRMKEVIAEYAPEESEYRDVTKVRTFLDEASFAAMKDSIKQMEEDHPDLGGIYNMIDSETVLKVITCPCVQLYLYTPLLTCYFTESRRPWFRRRFNSPCWSHVAISGHHQGV